MSGTLHIDPAVVGNLALNCGEITVSAMSGPTIVASTKAVPDTNDKRECFWELNSVPGGRQVTITTSGAAILVLGIPNLTSAPATTRPITLSLPPIGTMTGILALVVPERAIPTPQPVPTATPGAAGGDPLGRQR